MRQLALSAAGCSCGLIPPARACSPLAWTRLIYCPVAHGEGRLVGARRATLAALWNAGLAALIYMDKDDQPPGTAAYPACPNGSDWAIAGLCNPAGNVLGLMPHPENHIFPWQHPRWQRGERGHVWLAFV